MQPSTLSALISQLASGPASSAELTRALAISQPTLSRAIGALQRDGRLVRMGATRGTRYGLARSIDGIGSSWPLYRIDEQGGLTEIGPLHAVERNHFYAPRGPQRIRGFGEGIPYFLRDARPSGFLGRAVPHAFPELALPARIADWTDEHFLTYVTRRSADSIGDLVLGEESIERYLAASGGTSVIDASQRAARYGACAAAALAGSLPGSSAQGEQPKFLVRVDDSDHRMHVLVKFSPPRASDVGQRWVDLLRCEHLAHQLLSSEDLPTCRSRWFAFGERAYLEVERFDRVGAEGRRGAVSLQSVDLARYGKLDGWSECARRLEADHLLSARDTQRTLLVEAFAMLIANTDRHFGNIMLFDRYEGPFELAPVYDMLPMLFAPQHEQIVERTYEPPLPSVALLPVWARARALAQRYWRLLAGDALLSESFRGLAAQCLDTLRASSVRGVN